jgi:segregation and condensation protein A
MRRFYIGSPEWSPPRIPLQLPLGSGTLGWLVLLIRRQRLNVLEVALAPIAQACYEYWQAVGDLDEAADALAVLAYLAERKAERLLLPPAPPTPDEEPSEPIALALPEQYARLADHLRAREESQSLIFYRAMPIEREAYDAPLPWGAALPDELWLALRRLLERLAPLPDAIPERRYFSIHARMVEIQEQLRGVAAPMPFERVAQSARSVLDLLVYFLAMLELWRLGQIEVVLQGDTIWLNHASDGQTRQTERLPSDW